MVYPGTAGLPESLSVVQIVIAKGFRLQFGKYCKVHRGAYGIQQPHIRHEPKGVIKITKETCPTDGAYTYGCMQQTQQEIVQQNVIHTVAWKEIDRI